MNKWIILGIVAISLNVSFASDQDFISEDEFEKIKNQWFEFNGGDRSAQATYKNIMDEIQTTLEEQFPMSSELAQQIAALKAEKDAVLLAKAKEMGYESVEQAYASKDHALFGSLTNEYTKKKAQLMQDYLIEFKGLYRTTCAEALQRLMKNAEQMSK
ncbi:MAG TPA: hypothetical protein VKY57_03420 [Chitinispirillaceae bacterium]|nr:hypothetical protein [Chitinispirillaceae bacterium]